MHYNFGFREFYDKYMYCGKIPEEYCNSCTIIELYRYGITWKNNVFIYNVGPDIVTIVTVQCSTYNICSTIQIYLLAAFTPCTIYKFLYTDIICHY